MKTLLGVLSLSLIGCVADDDLGQDEQQVSDLDTNPTGHGGGIFNKFAGPDNHAGNGGGHTVPISFHGGPVMTNPAHIYYIWYGDWSGKAADQSVLDAYANGVGASAYYAINLTYTSGSGQHVSSSVTLAGSTTDSGSQGTSNLSDTAIQNIVAANYSKFGAADPDGVYFVMTAPNVTKSGMCTSYCGWHTHATIGGKDVKYSFVGAPTSCGSGAYHCEGQALGPNNTEDGDNMASIVAHEFEEATSDPDLNAWYDRRGYENADKCAWTFGTTQTVANGAEWNVTIGTTKMLIQRNWNASSQRCERVLGSAN